MTGCLAAVSARAMPEQRDENLEKIRLDGAFDVIVLGGGINGIGVFRDLSLQGLRVLLVEQNDFCSGCSAALSRMIHGGLRYLENGEFDLVRESLRERDALLANAPHMVRPLPTTIPIRSIFSGMLNGVSNFLRLSETPSSRGAIAIKAGLSLYDWTTRKRRVLPRHTFRTAQQTFAKWPCLDPKLRYSATYHDAWISYPERLGIELIADTARLAPQSIALNYARLSHSAGRFELADSVTGNRLTVSAGASVNATGAWIDETAPLLGADSTAGRLVEGTKGSHLVVKSRELYEALNGHMIFYENEDGRVCIAFPYLGNVLAGSTDIRVGQVRRVRCEPDEFDYILASLRVVFPGITVLPEQVVYTYSGIRPLPKSEQAFTGRISRDHFVRKIEGDVPQFGMIGGKWTTFRAFAEQTADAVLLELGRPRHTETINLAIGGGDGFVGDGSDITRDLIRHFGITKSRGAHLVETYGSRATEVMSFCRSVGDDVRLIGETEITNAEIIYLIRHEYVVGLSDLLQRRTSLAIKGHLSTRLIDQVADILGRELGWESAARRHQVQTFIADLQHFHGVSREMLDQPQDRSPACA